MEAPNLDGGGSSTLVVNGALVNRPTGGTGGDVGVGCVLRAGGGLMVISKNPFDGPVINAIAIAFMGQPSSNRHKPKVR